MIGRQARTRLRIVAVVAALGVAIGIAISWLLSHINQSTYDLAEFENGARNGLTVVATLVAFDLFYLHGPRGAWLRRLSFGRTVLIRAALLTLIIVLCFSLNRLIFGLLYGLERAGLEYFGLELLRDTVIAFVVSVVITEFLQMRRVIDGRTLNNLLLERYWRPVREERVSCWSTSRARPRSPSEARLGTDRGRVAIAALPRSFSSPCDCSME